MIYINRQSTMGKHKTHILAAAWDVDQPSECASALCGMMQRTGPDFTISTAPAYGMCGSCQRVLTGMTHEERIALEGQTVDLPLFDAIRRQDDDLRELLKGIEI